MKKILILILILVCVITLNAQMVEKNPEFLGGNFSLKEFVVNNIKYPPIARECGIEGIVLVDFIINIDGSVSNVKISHGVSNSINNEALRVIRSLPKWNPALVGGKAVSVLRTIPIKFQLN